MRQRGGLLTLPYGNDLKHTGIKEGMETQQLTKAAES